jgi:branched-chain amino acid transport system substrate-binding protein
VATESAKLSGFPLCLGSTLRNSMILRGAAIAVCSLVLPLLASGCGDDGNSAPAAGSKGLPEEIIIGAAIAKTGYMAPYDASIAALEQLVRKTNAEGGIAGRRLAIVEANTRSDPQHAPVAALKVIEGGADVLLLSGEAFTAAAAAPVAEENGRLSFSISNEPGYGPPTTGRLSFSSSASLLSESSSAASFLYRRGVRRPFMLRDISIIYGKAYCSGFEQTWAQLDATIAGSADFRNEDASIATQIAQVNGSEADAIVICSYPPGGAAAIKQIRAAGLDLPIIAPSAFDGTFWLKGISDTGQIYATSNGSSHDPPDRQTADLLDKLQRGDVNTDASSNLLATYAAGELIIAAIRDTDTVDGHVLADALEKNSYRTIVGESSYTSDDHFLSRVWPIYSFPAGTQRLVARVRPRFSPSYGG